MVSADFQSPKSLIVFGDSLVDVGNDPVVTYIQTLPDGSSVPSLVSPPPTRYDRGHFSNGPVMVDYLAAKFSGLMKPSETGIDLARDNVSYAFGGSETGLENYTPGLFSVPGLGGQVLKFETDLLASNVQIGRALFVVWSGANNYMNSLSLGNAPDPYEIVDNIVHSVNKLTELGAKQVIVVNLPNLGATPICQVFGICDVLTNLTEVHNDLLENAFMGNRKVILFDANSVVQRILLDPVRYGISENVSFGPATGCLFQVPAEFDIANCSRVDFNTKSFYWDEIHPTTKVHKILARVLWRKLSD